MTLNQTNAQDLRQIQDILNAAIENKTQVVFIEHAQERSGFVKQGMNGHYVFEAADGSTFRRNLLNLRDCNVAPVK